VSAAWKDFQGNTGVGQAVALTSDTGYFWFFGSSNVEVVVKALDGRVLNDHFWIFYGALSNVKYTLTVTDTVTGIVKKYSNPSGLFASVGDTIAFGKPTTFQLIQGAVVKGEINDETALLYKVYAFFGDARLPQVYQGDPPGQREHGILREVADRWSTLSTQTQQALEPFLIPPIYPESWFAQTSVGRTRSPKRPGSVLSDWTKIPTVRPVVVWYRAADAGAETAANYIASQVMKVWDEETGLMGRKPVADDGKPKNGGDGSLDIYLLPSFRDPDLTDAAGAVLPYLGQDAGKPRAAYILLRTSSVSTIETASDVLAHEFFHTIAENYAYYLGSEYPDYRWLNEATAQWMEDYVYPTQIHNLEQKWAPPYFLEGYKESFNKPEGDAKYEDYLFFFYLARASQADVNRRIWDNVERTDSLHAIDSVIPGHFKERWPEFALYCWNHPGVDKFREWDGLAGHLPEGLGEPHANVSVTPGYNIAYPLAGVSIEPLAMNYAHLTVDDSVKRLEIRNRRPSSGSENAKTQAWIKLADGSTRTEDWTGPDKERVVFCRDKALQNVTELLVLYTNSDTSQTGDPIVFGDGKVSADAIGCGGFRGSAHSQTSGRDATNSGSVSETIDVAVVFQLGGSPEDETAYYRPVQMTMRYAATIKPDSGCTLTIGPVTETLTGDAVSSSDSLYIDKSLNPPVSWGEAGDGFMTDKTIRCPDGSATYPSVAGGEWLKIPKGLFRVNPDGSLSGSYTEGIRTWTWDLRPD
jgi:hypothetical protein